MAPTTLQAFVREKPFRPFRIVMNSGNAFEIRHPEMIRVGHDHFVFFQTGAPEDIHDRFEILSLVLVENVKHIDQAAPTTTGNGPVKQ